MPRLHLTLLPLLPLAALTLLAAPAAASGAPPASPAGIAHPWPSGYGTPGRWAAPEPRKRWYGWQNLTVLGVGHTISVVGGFGGPALALGGLGVALLGSPIVHFAHERIGAGFGSLGLHLGLPAVVGLAGAGVGCAVSCDDGIGAAAGFVLGVGLGHVAAIVIDVAWLAREEVEGGARAERRLRVPTLVPVVTPVETGATFGALGVF